MEQNLDKILSAIQGLDVSEFNPRLLIRAVNVLRAMGKDRAIEAVHDFLRRHPSKPSSYPHIGISYLSRFLFDIPTPPGYFPPMDLGATEPPQPLNERLVPRFPLVIMGDIPLMVIGGWSSGGSALQYPSQVTSFFPDEGTLRANPLTPMDNPLEVIARLENSPQWLWGKRYPSASKSTSVDPPTRFDADAA